MPTPLPTLRSRAHQHRTAQTLSGGPAHPRHTLAQVHATLSPSTRTRTAARHGPRAAVPGGNQPPPTICWRRVLQTVTWLFPRPLSRAALGLALALEDAGGIWALCADSDGIDGKSDAAGAVAAPDTLARARAAGLDPRAMLAAHDSYGVFEALGDLLVTGPTLTNVNDLRAVIVA